MKLRLFVILFLLLVNVISYSQSIRKNFQEMTASEISEVVNAFYLLRDVNLDGATIEEGDANPEDDDLIYDLSVFHNDYFSFDEGGIRDIHLNLTEEDSIQIFFGWHRYQMFEMEQAMQEINPKLSLGYWDSSVDNDRDDLLNSLFHEDFLGSFNTNWGLNRNYTGYNLPSVSEVTNEIISNNPFTSSSTYHSFSNRMERGPLHIGGHVWTGGVMQTRYSPADPVFYFHHSWIDKLWEDWEKIHPNQSNFNLTSMIRYDGTYAFNGVTLPLVDPNSIIHSSSLGVFYAEDQLAELSNYTVSNTYKPTEYFYYQYTIKAGDNFIVPNGTTGAIESVNNVLLEPGFFAESGANLVVKIDADNDLNTANRNPDVRRYNPFIFSYLPMDDVYSNFTVLSLNDNIENKNSIRVYPTPFVNNLNLDLNIKNYEILIHDVLGRLVFDIEFTNSSKKIQIDNLDYLPEGIYILSVKNESKIVYKTKIVKSN